MSARKTIEKMIELDNEHAKLLDVFDKFPVEDRSGALKEMFETLTKNCAEDEPLPLGLIRCADLLVNLEGELSPRLLSKGLSHINPDIRLLCGDGLIHLAAEGLSRIMPAVELTLAEGGLGAEEMPLLLADVDDEQVPSVLERFLENDNAEVVASAIEAVAEFGDPSSIPALMKLKQDKRPVAVEEDESGTWTIGKIAQEAISMLSGD